MDEADSNKLRSNHVELIRCLNPEDVTDYLYQERVLTQEDVERIDAGPTRAQKARIFVAILQLKSENALVKFLEALKEGGYDELAGKLENPDMAANTAAVQASDSTELEELKEALREQSEMVQAINKELEQVKLNTQEDSGRIEMLEAELKKERTEKSKLVGNVYIGLQKKQEESEEVLEEEAKVMLKVDKPVKRSPSKTFSRLLCGSPRNAECDAERDNPRVKRTIKDCRIKCVLVGNGAVGKTCLQMALKTNSFLSEYIPTVFENDSIERRVETGKRSISVKIDLYDTAGQEDYDRLRTLSYPNTDVFVLVFNVTSPETLENVMEKWYPEIKHFVPKAPRVLVGNKVDLASEKNTLRDLEKMKQRPVTQRQADSLAMKIKAMGDRAYLVSAKTQHGLQEMTTAVVQAALVHQGVLKKVKGKLLEPILKISKCD